MPQIAQKTARARGKPAIVIGDADHRNLTSLALAMEQRMPDVSEALLDELDRAKVVPQTSRGGLQARLWLRRLARASGSALVLRRADIDAGRISIMTPVGAALIGLARPVDHLTSRDGRVQELTIVTRYAGVGRASVDREHDADRCRLSPHDRTRRSSGTPIWKPAVGDR